MKSLLLVLLTFASFQLIAAPKSKKAAPPEVAIPVAETDYALTRIYRYKLNFMLGMGVIDSSALVSGVQFGFSPFAKTPLYLGPEMNFALFSPGSIFSTLFGGWYEMKIEGAPALAISLGASAGPAFPSFISKVSSTSLAVFGDVTISQEIDDLVSIRGQFRPGMVGRLFAFMMAFNLSFRFS